jgi:hypothetical protein
MQPGGVSADPMRQAKHGTVASGCARCAAAGHKAHKVPWSSAGGDQYLQSARGGDNGLAS